MRKYGKYEKMPDGARAKQPAAKSMLLQTYLTSLLCLVLCVSMFFGTSYAWFTSEVKNEGNEIYIGTLDAKLEVLKNSQWVNVEQSPEVKLFDDSISWEPGYTSLETIQVGNEGDLSFRYMLTFTDGKLDGVKNDEALIKVAQFFTVYIHAGEFTDTDPRPVSFSDIKTSAEAEDGTWRAVKMGKDPATLADILTRGFPVLSDNMEQQGETDTYVIALHMLETAGEGATEDASIALSKDLMGKKIELNVKLTAYQRTHEEDAFNKDYDLRAHVTKLGALDIRAMFGIGGNQHTMMLDETYQFQPVETIEEWNDSSFKDYIADFVIWCNEDVPENSVALAGYYDAWCRYNNHCWVYLQSPEKISAGKQIPLVGTLAGNPIVHYKDLCQYGNDGIGFLCGVKNLSEENVGKVITVELRLYDPDNLENYVVAGRYEYTLEEPTGTIVPIS